MLITLKHSQHKIASVVLSLFMGSWLLLLCQTCLAVMDDINEQNKPVSELSTSCHTDKIDESINEKINDNNEQCLGACDCDGLVVTVNSEKNPDLTEKTKISPDLYVYIENQLKVSNRAPPTHRISLISERTILLPFQHYTVLLI